MTDEVVIRVEGLGKKYSIRHQRDGGYKTLREALTGRAKNLFRRNGRSSDVSVSDSQHFSVSSKEDFWALKDVSFEVKRGEVLGIIGRNGAGKSTLLKILSRITEPTEGKVRIKGRVASLLEVGTGFHPELTGRENIFLNGAILGMSRAEIQKKFDEIVAFAEIEKFLDTPVKRYSSGMYVRLAFAVAAHLDPEILIVDEVLAVGDTQFQKKCLGKMETVAAREGRTVLFVSHNMAAVSALCGRCLLIDNGRLSFEGDPDRVIDRYLRVVADQQLLPMTSRSDREGTCQVKFTGVEFLDSDLKPAQLARVGAELVIALSFERGADILGTPSFEVGMYNYLQQLVFLCGTDFTGAEFTKLPKAGRLLCRIPSCPLPPGTYDLNIYCGDSGSTVDWIKGAARLEVGEGDFFGTGRLPPQNAGLIFQKHSWELQSNSVDPKLAPEHAV